MTVAEPRVGITFPETTDTRREMVRAYERLFRALAEDATIRVGASWPEGRHETAEPAADDAAAAPEQSEGGETDELACVGSNHVPGCEHMGTAEAEAQEDEADSPYDREDVLAWAGVPVVTRRALDEALAAVFGQAIPAPDEQVAEVSSPATIYVSSECPNCHQVANLALTELAPDLTVHADGTRELKLKAKTKAQTHICGQIPWSVRTAGAAIAEGQEALPLAEAPAETPVDGTEEDVLAVWALLGLVIPPDDLPSLETVRGWDAATLRQVGDWAAAEHLAASDNDVERLPRPRVLGGEADPVTETADDSAEDGDLLPGEPVAADPALVDDGETEPVITSMRPSVGEPVVFDGDKLRIKSISGQDVYARASFGGVSANFTLDELVWDDAVGVWRVREG